MGRQPVLGGLMLREQYLGHWVTIWPDSQGVWWAGAREIGRNSNEWRKRHCQDIELAKAWVREKVGVTADPAAAANAEEPAPTAEQWRVFYDLMAQTKAIGPPEDVVLAFGALHLFEVTRDEQAIKGAYRMVVKAWHPDKGGNAVEFGRVKGAYERALKWARQGK